MIPNLSVEKSLPKFGAILEDSAALEKALAG